MKLFLLLLLFLQAPPAPRQQQKATPPHIGVTSTTGPHQAVLNWSNASCTTNSQCSIQAYRAQCTSLTTCPTWPAGTWVTLSMTTGLVPTIGSSGSSWVYTDKDPALQDSTVYSWVATNTYVGGSNSSGASANYAGATNNGTPPAPTLSSSGNSVN
jgi:hypothetical protein